MPTTDSVTIVLKALDQASAAIQQTRAQLDGFARTQDRATGSQQRFNDASGTADRQTRRLNNAIGNLTSANGLAATAIARMQGVLVGVPFGLVIGAASALTESLIQQAIKWLDLETAASRAEKTLARFGRTMAQSVQPALLPIQTRIEEIDKQLGNINARTPQAAAAILSRLEAEKANLTRLRDTILGPEPHEQTRAELAQEAAGRNILARRQVEIADAKRHAEALAFQQESLGRDLLSIAIRQRDEGAVIQEQRGLIIRDQAAREFAERGAHQEALGQQIQDAARYELAIREEVEQRKSEAVARFGQVMAASVAQAVLGQASLGKALKAGLAQTLAAIAGEAAVRAIFETAMGFAALFINPAKAAAHFQAAAIFGIVGVAAGAAGAKFAGGAGGGGGGAGPSALPTTSRELAPVSSSAQPLPQQVTIYINGNLVDLSQLSRELRPFNIQLTRDTI